MPGAASSLVTGSHTKTVDATSSLRVDLQGRLIGTIFSTASPLMEEPCTLGEKKAEAHDAKEVEPHIFEAMRIELHTSEALEKGGWSKL